MLRRLKNNSSLTPNLTMMPGLSHLKEFQEKGLRFGTETDGVRLGHTKGMLNLTTGAPQPPIEELTEMIENAESFGFPVALHAIEQEAIEIAINLLERGQKQNLRHRIEHAAECPPETLSILSKIGIGVVTQPGFIYSNGDRYISEVPSEIQPWLYRMNSLQQALPWIAASSDAPVGNLNPMLGVYAAITRNTQNGQQIAPEEKITIQEALALYTKNAAWATCDEANKGTITAGGIADLVLFSEDPTKVNPDELMKLKIQLTMVKGQSGM
jgi:predicted amidohydrolase YtcJ